MKRIFTAMVSAAAAMLVLAGPIPIDVPNCCASKPGKPFSVQAMPADDAWDW